MTAHELAKKLLVMQDVPVTVRGYEGGVDIIESISEPADLALNVHDKWYYGRHEYTASYKELENYKHVLAIHLNGE